MRLEALGPKSQMKSAQCGKLGKLDQRHVEGLVAKARKMLGLTWPQVSRVTSLGIQSSAGCGVSRPLLF